MFCTEVLLSSSKVMFNCLEVSLFALSRHEYPTEEIMLILVIIFETFLKMFICSYVLTCTPVRGFGQ